MRRAIVVTVALGVVAVGCGRGEEPAIQAPGRTPAASPAATAAGTPAASHATTAAVAAPTLRILSPRDGDTVTSPVKVRYEVLGFEVGPAPKGHMHAIYGPGAQDYAPVPLRAQSGEVEVSIPTGTRTVTFQLARANHQLLTNPEAKVTLRLRVTSGAAGGGY